MMTTEDFEHHQTCGIENGPVGIFHTLSTFTLVYIELVHLDQLRDKDVVHLPCLKRSYLSSQPEMK